MSSTECNRLRTAALAALGALAAAAACSDGSPRTPDASVETTPAVLVAERVFTSPTTRQYILTVLADAPSGMVDRSGSLVLDSADVELFDGKIYVRSRTANTMTRYAVTADRKLVKDSEFSFATLGVEALRFSNAYVSADRAYLMDSFAWRLIGWNPSTMALTGEVISIAGMKKDATLTGSISPAVQVGTRLMAAINWANFTTLAVYPGSGLLVIDPATPSMPKFVEDTRVGGGFRVTAVGGDAYLTGTVGGDVRKFGSAFGGGALPQSGLVKLAAGQAAFDASYLVDVEAITGTKAVGAVHRLGDTTLLAQIYDPALDLPATLNEFRTSTSFEFVFIDPVQKTFTPVVGVPKGGLANGGNHVVDGKLYIQIGDATGSTAYSASATGLTEAFRVPLGDLWFMARVR